MAKVHFRKSGKVFIRLSAREKRQRFKNQLRTGIVGETGKKLSTEDIAFRKGFLSGQKSMYKKKKKKTNK